MYQFLKTKCLLIAGVVSRITVFFAQENSSNGRSMRRLLTAIAALTGISLFFGLATSVLADSATNASSVAPTNVQIPPNSPAYLRSTYLKALAAPRPNEKQSDAPPAVFNSQTYPNPHGDGGIYQQGGAVNTSGNAFFQSLGTNGRSCFSCHKPNSGMGVSAETVQKLFLDSRGKDPIFAPVDGANCPSSVPAANTSAALIGGHLGGGQDSFAGSHSLLLNKGLIRVFLPVPKQTNDLSVVGLPPHPTEFTISVVSDPNGCNTNPLYATHVDPVTQEVSQIVSVYRRPRITSNFQSALVPAASIGFGYLPNINNVTGAPVVDPITGQPVSGNIMWDGREMTLQSQAMDATLTHAQATTPPTAAQIAQIVAFESNTFAAQSALHKAGDLTGADGSAVYGGPKVMSTQPLTLGNYTDFDNWMAPPDSSASAKVQKRASIARGQDLFNNFTFTATNIGGFNNGGVLIPAPVPATCSACHIAQAGTSLLPQTQFAIGTGGQSVKWGGPAPSKDLPIFKLTCAAPYTSPYDGPVVYTNDPGRALITGRCMDIGGKSVPQLRALASRAPYFSDGSSATLRDVVEFYNKRFTMKLTEQQKQDMTSFLEAL